MSNNYESLITVKFDKERGKVRNGPKTYQRVELIIKKTNSQARD